MLNIAEQHRAYYESVIEFAKKIGKFEDSDPHSLKYGLDYLDKYAAHNYTRCNLYKDFAPASFGFMMEIAKRRCRCLSCHEQWSWTVRVTETSNLSGEATIRCPKCEERATFSAPREWVYWFNGGLLYHGNHDGFGSGEAPTLAVTLNPTDGWSIHT